EEISDFTLQVPRLPPQLINLHSGGASLQTTTDPNNGSYIQGDDLGVRDHHNH
ncbi:MAG: hypothetical protein RLZZ170_733, partial [Actinomycetota bacterium]